MELFLALFLLFMKRERRGRVEVRTWLRRLTLGTADERFRLHQTERGWGVTMIKINTLSMAVFAIFVNTSVLLSFSA